MGRKSAYRCRDKRHVSGRINKNGGNLCPWTAMIASRQVQPLPRQLKGKKRAQMILKTSNLNLPRDRPREWQQGSRYPHRRRRLVLLKKAMKAIPNLRDSKLMRRSN